ncbi:MAG: DNA polymerase III subunit gamma/tau, partial [Candidatus Azambacteria bacterium]|nr:DNA polymerase III subunit gamma/tau [Candidatus Azambacteria bacterium]
MAEALYRKYRPNGFDEVIGQEHIVQTLRNAIAHDAVAHAYLFVGPRGTGKTTLARILAKAVNCLEAVKHKGQPCNKCQNCEDIAAGRALDIIEIDAASNRGIDEIRELREGARLSPSQMKYKVYIIDEAHQLTKEAFNALLKILEEPPAHVIFILATTAADKMPPTILSRVQRFDFKKFSIQQIEAKLEKILAQEKIKADAGAIRMIAHAAEGGLRDAESMLSQVLSHTQKGLTEETVQGVLGVASFKQVSNFVDLAAQGGLKEMLVYINIFYNEGGSAEEFLKALANYTRKLTLLKIDVGMRESVVPELTDDQFSVMVAQVKQFELADLRRMCEALIEAQENTKRTSLPLLPLELAL